MGNSRASRCVNGHHIRHSRFFCTITFPNLSSARDSLNFLSPICSMQKQFKSCLLGLSLLIGALLPQQAHAADKSDKPASTLTAASDVYVAPGISVGSSTQLTFALGGHYKNINLEAEYRHSLAEATALYLNNPTGNVMPRDVSYKPSMLFGIKAGYGICVGSRFKFTPQAGMRFVKISETTDGPTYIDGANCTALTLGCRAYMAIIKNVGISLTPEYALPMAQSDGYKRLTGVSDNIKSYISPVGINAAVVVAF